MTEYLNINEIKNPPSGFLPYTEGTVITANELPLGDVMKISDTNLSMMEIYKIRMKYIKTEKINVKDLTWQDFLFACFMCDFLSLDDDKFALDFICNNPNCTHNKENTSQEAIITYDRIDYEDLGENIEKTYGKKITKLPLIFNKKGKEYKFTPLSLKWVMFLSEKGLINDAISRYACMLVLPFVLDMDKMKPYAHIKDDESKILAMQFDSAKEVLSNEFNLKDINVLKSIDEIFRHGVKPIEQPCGLCGEVNRITVDTAYTVIRSFRETGTILGDEIQLM